MPLRQFLEQAELSPRQFATMIAVTHQAVYRYLAGRIPAPMVVAAIVRVTKALVTPNDLYLGHPRAGPAIRLILAGKGSK